MSILPSDSAGVKPASFDVRRVDDTDCDIPHSGDDRCGCNDCLEVARWESIDRAAFLCLDLSDSSQEDPDMDPIEPIDRAWQSGFALGLDLAQAEPPRGLPSDHVIAWFNGFNAGVSQARREVLAAIDELTERLDQLGHQQPEDFWHEAEIALARSNSGHPGWEN